MSICTLTDSAKRQIDFLCDENDCYAISLNLKGGGCAGFEYDWNTVTTPADLEPGDEVIHTGVGTGRFVIGAHSVMFLIGTELDYVRSIVGSNFEIKNPNAKSSCGCGVSVNFDMDSIPHFMG
jgi:iron-sulfur cluster assembly protein